MIFNCWRHASKQQRAFIACVVNVLNKSMKTKGFHYIKQTSLDVNYNNKVTRMLTKFSKRHSRMNGLDSFNKWKLYSLSKVDEKFTNTMMQLKEKDGEFNEHVDQIKEQNNARVLNLFMTKNASNVFNAWVNIVKHQKLVKAKEFEFLQRQYNMQRKLAIKMWKQRLDTTKYLRTREELLIRKINKRKRRAVIKALRDQFRNVSDLSKSLSRLELYMRSKIMFDSYNTIKTFSASRQNVDGNDKEVGTIDIMRMIRQAYFKKLQNGFFRFRNNTGTTHQKSNKLKSLFGKISSQRLRKVFNNWRWAHGRAELLDD